MAILTENANPINGNGSNDDVVGDLLQRLDQLEREFYHVNLNVQNLYVENSVASIKFEALKSLVCDAEKKAWTETLTFRDSRIQSSNIWRGDVDACFNRISEEMEQKMVRKQRGLYVGLTCDPERRMKEHTRKKCDTKEPDVNMILVYRSSQLSRSAEMESRLLNGFSTVRNVSKHSQGIMFGKPSYFVYFLRRL